MGITSSQTFISFGRFRNLKAVFNSNTLRIKVNSITVSIKIYTFYSMLGKCTFLICKFVRTFWPREATSVNGFGDNPVNYFRNLLETFLHWHAYTRQWRMLRKVRLSLVKFRVRPYNCCQVDVPQNHTLSRQ